MSADFGHVAASTQEASATSPLAGRRDVGEFRACPNGTVHVCSFSKSRRIGMSADFCHVPPSIREASPTTQITAGRHVGRFRT